MILIFNLLNSKKENLYFKSVVEENYFSEFQLRTINNTFPRLVNIVSLMKSNIEDNITFRTFTVTNLWIQIFSHNQYYFIFVSPAMTQTNANKTPIVNEYVNLVKTINKLLINYAMQDNNVLLTENENFNRSIFNYLYKFNQTSELLSDRNSQELPSLNTFKKEASISVGRYLMVGTAAVGKSSIIAQFFEDWDLKKLENIRPTILKQASHHEDKFIGHNFNLLDLGGQESYIKSHLEDENLFKNVNTLIYVVNIQNEDKKQIFQSKNYLIDILEKLKINNESTIISIFLHKFDPSIEAELSNSVQFWIAWIDATLKSYNNPYTFNLTSIKTNSAREALARTLLLTLPQAFMTHAIQKDLILKSVSTLYPLIDQIKRQLQTNDEETITRELYLKSVLFGQTASKQIVQNWLEFLSNESSDINKVARDTNDISLDFIEERGVAELKLVCPLLRSSDHLPFTENSQVCSITHGLINGLSQFMGLGNSKVIQTEIKNKTNHCLFAIEFQ